MSAAEQCFGRLAAATGTFRANNLGAIPLTPGKFPGILEPFWQIKNPLADQRVCFGAKDGIRTRDPDLGKVVLYQLSYFRVKECEYTKA